MKLFLSKLVGKCREIYPDYNPIEKLAELTKTPVFIQTFKFGKYKGKDWLTFKCPKCKFIYNEEEEYKF